MTDKPENEDEKKDCEVGYKKPPKDTQFKKGQSGNPKGRPPLKDLRKLVVEEMNASITFTVNGQSVTKTQAEAMIKKTMNRALEGDHKARDYLSKNYEKGKEKMEEEIKKEQLDQADIDSLEFYYARNLYDEPHKYLWHIRNTYGDDAVNLPKSGYIPPKVPRGTFKPYPKPHDSDNEGELA